VNRSTPQHPVNRKQRVAVLEGDHLDARQHGAVKYLSGTGGLLRPGRCDAEEGHEYDDGCADPRMWVHMVASLWRNSAAGKDSIQIRGAGGRAAARYEDGYPTRAPSI